MTRLARVAPPLARLAIKRATRTAERSPEKFSRQFDKDLSPPDLELHREPAFRQAVREIFLESTRQGPDGVVHEYRLNGTLWGSRSRRSAFAGTLARLLHGRGSYTHDHTAVNC